MDSPFGDLLETQYPGTCDSFKWPEDPPEVPEPVLPALEEAGIHDRKCYYCFTCFSFGDDWKSFLREIFLRRSPKVIYLLGGLERCPDTDRFHIQGYIKFANAIERGSAAKLLNNAHLQTPYKCFLANFRYCTKEDNWTEFGTRPAENERPISDKKRKRDEDAQSFATAKALAKEGRLDEIDPELMIKHFMTLSKLKLWYLRNRKLDCLPSDHIVGVWYYGKTGTGKSHAAREDYPGAYIKIPDNKWWDNYEDQDNVILDDVARLQAHWLGAKLKQWVDRYPVMVEVKGGSMMIRPRQIIVTSNYHPNELWEGDPQVLEPIMRRFKVVHFKTLSDAVFGSLPVQEERIAYNNNEA